MYAAATRRGSEYPGHDGGAMTRWQYRCDACGWQEGLSHLAWCCPACGGVLALSGAPELSAARVLSDRPGLWRYGATLPVELDGGRWLGEGLTPLVPGRLASRDVWFKCDSSLPTGSFKDRGAAVLVAYMRQRGLRRVVVDSSGNAAAAMACYCAAAGLDCAVYAPAATSPAKLTQARAFGARVRLVAGDRQAVADAARDAAARDSGAFYASHNWHPIFVEGVKTWALEVWEQLGHRAPAAIFTPAGGGSALVGAWRGFQALTTVCPLPRLFAAQPAVCAPLVTAIETGEGLAPVTPGETLAEGAKIGAPARAEQMRAAVTASDGGAIAIGEELLVATLRALWAQGLYVEPTAALGAAACSELIGSGLLPDGELVVHLTGSGLKATATIESLL